MRARARGRGHALLPVLLCESIARRSDPGLSRLHGTAWKEWVSALKEWVSALKEWVSALLVLKHKSAARALSFSLFVLKHGSTVGRSSQGLDASCDWGDWINGWTDCGGARLDALVVEGEGAGGEGVLVEEVGAAVVAGVVQDGGEEEGEDGVGAVREDVEGAGADEEVVDGLEDVGGVGGVVVGVVAVEALDEPEPVAHDGAVEVEGVDEVVPVEEVPAERLEGAVPGRLAEGEDVPVPLVDALQGLADLAQLLVVDREHVGPVLLVAVPKGADDLGRQFHTPRDFLERNFSPSMRDGNCFWCKVGLQPIYYFVVRGCRIEVG